MRTPMLAIPIAMLALVVACGEKAESADTGQPDVPQADVGENLDEVPPDPGTPDPVTPDFGKPDPGPKDPGPADTAPPKDPGPGPDTTQADIPAQCPAVVTGPTCAEKVACALQCADVTYKTACVGSVSDQATDQAQAALACLAGLDCGPLVLDEWFTDCAFAVCKAEIDACFAGTGNCNDVRKCRMACDVSDPACPLRCWAEATLEEQDVWAKYRACIMGADCVEKGEVMPNGWPTENCERYAQNYLCPLQTQACIPPQ